MEIQDSDMNGNSNNEIIYIDRDGHYCFKEEQITNVGTIGALFDTKNFNSYLEDLGNSVTEMINNYRVPFIFTIGDEIKKLKKLVEAVELSLSGNYKPSISDDEMWQMGISGFAPFKNQNKVNEDADRYIHTKAFIDAANGERVHIPITKNVYQRKSFFYEIMDGGKTLKMKFVPKDFMKSKCSTLFFKYNGNWNYVHNNCDDEAKEYIGIVNDFVELSNQLNAKGNVDIFEKIMFKAHEVSNIEKPMKFLIDLIAAFNAIDAQMRINTDVRVNITNIINKIAMDYKKIIKEEDETLLDSIYTSFRRISRGEKYVK